MYKEFLAESLYVYYPDYPDYFDDVFPASYKIIYSKSKYTF